MEPLILIVDDERLSRDYIHDLVQEFQPRATVLEAASVIQAEELLREHKIDLLFLDVKMPGRDGFSLFDRLEEKDFEVVFITAHGDFAIKAFKHGACDYLLKPLDKAEFKQALERAWARRERELKTRDLEQQAQHGTTAAGRLQVSQQSGIVSVELKHILYLKADNTSTNIYMDDGRMIHSSRSLQHYESVLDPRRFTRLHKSHMVNLLQVKAYNNEDEKKVILSNGAELNISRYRLRDFLNLYKQL